MPVNEHVNAGDPITDVAWNRLADAAFARQGPLWRHRGSYFLGKNATGGSMPPFGVGRITGQTVASQDPRLIIGLDDEGEGILVTNDAFAIPNGETGQVRVIDDQPVQVISTGTINQGDPCGLDGSSNPFTVSTDNSGLIAVTAASSNKVWVARDIGDHNWLVETTTTITAASYTTGITLGSGSAKYKQKASGSAALNDRTGPITHTFYSAWPYAIPSGHIMAATRTQWDTLVLTSWLSKPHLFCRFTLSAALGDTATGSATIQSYIGYGASHSSTSITVKNLLANGGSTSYVFEGDSGDYGLAYYDPTSGSTTWQIVQMECP